MSSVTIDPISKLGIISSEKGLEAFAVSSGEHIWSRPFLRAPERPYNRQTGLALLSSSGAATVFAVQFDYLKFCLLDFKNGSTLSEVALPDFYSGTPSYFAGKIYLALQGAGLIQISLE